MAKKNEQTKNNFSEKSKDKVVQSSNNSLGQHCFGCQGYRHVRSKCPTYLRSKGKDIAVTLSDDEESGHEFESDQEGNFIDFTTTVVVGELKLLRRTLPVGNSLRMLTCKRLTTIYARLQQKML